MQDKVIFLIILSGALAMYFTQRVSVIITALITITTLVMADLVTLDQALSGFSSSATIAIGAMFVLSGGLIKTGALEPLASMMAKWSGGNYTKLILVMALTIPVASAFTNNTPVVVMMVPVIMGLSRDLKIPPSKLLMPLSYLAILGGTCTLIGTSTNLLIDEDYRLSTGTHLGIFDFTPLGVIILVVGVVFILLFGRRLLPYRESLSSILPASQRSRYVTEVIVKAASPLVGRLIKETFPRGSALKFVQLLRANELHIAATAGKMEIKAEDALILEGSPKDLTDLIANSRVELGTVLEDAERVPMRTFSLTMFELVILPDSSLIGNKVKDLSLNKGYGVKVLAIQRGGRHHRMDIRNMRVKAGDMLLVQGDETSIEALKEGHDFLVVEEVAAQIPVREKATSALAIMAAVVLLTTFTNLPLVIWALAGVVVLVFTRCMTTKDCIVALDFNVLFLLIGTIPLGAALETTGLTTDISNFVIGIAGDSSPMVLIGTIYLVTNVLTSLISNTAVAVLMTPLAIGIAGQLGIEAKPLVMTVAFAASAAFATPIGYQTNVIVMGPAGYTFGDYLRLGLPLSVVTWITATIAIPIIWPL